MNSPFFISVTIIKTDGSKQLRFINTNHIIQLYEENDKVYIELTEYTIYQIDISNIHSLMDRFIR